MNVETFLAIASLAIAVGGLVALFFPEGRRKVTVLAVALAAILVLAGVALYEHSMREAVLKEVQEEVIEELSSGPMTFDQLYQAVHYKPFPTVSEALFRAVKEKVVGHEMIDLRVNGKPVRVRNYFVIQ